MDYRTCEKCLLSYLDGCFYVLLKLIHVHESLSLKYDSNILRVSKLIGFVCCFTGERRGKPALFLAVYFLGEKKNHWIHELFKLKTIFNMQLYAFDEYFSFTEKELKLMEGKDQITSN